MNILSRIWWNRKHHNRGCKGVGLRCTCGDMGSLNPFGGSDDSSDSTGAGQSISNIGSQVQQQAAMSPQATAQWQNTYPIEQYLAQLMGQNVGQPGATAQGLTSEQQFQNQGPLSQALYNQTLQQAQNPTAGWQSTLAPQLSQAQDTINKYYNTRGLMNSGMAIGSMGQAGVDLAIQNAQNEMAYQQQSLANAQSLSTNASGLGQQNLQNLTGLAGQQQQTGLAGQQLAQQGYQAGAEYQAYPQQAALGSYYSGIASQQALPGELIGAGGQLGGDFMLASALGCWVASEVFGGWTMPKTVSSRIWINFKAPLWFKSFYLKHGENIALFIHNKPILKCILRPLFELFARLGEV